MITSDVIINLRKRCLFVIRQIYRLLIIFPFLIVVQIIHILTNYFCKKNTTEPLVDNCFVVSSVIFPHPRRLTYASRRSVFTPDQRIAQTIETVLSIRKYASSAKIILVEGGMVGDLPKTLLSLVDEYIYVGGKSLVRWACDSWFKSLGEAMMLLSAAKQIEKIRAKLYFKISGRYVLNEQFNPSDYVIEKFSFHSIRSDFFSTRLYSFPGELFSIWTVALLKGLPYNLMDYPIEHTLYKFIPKKFISAVATLGIGGLDATGGLGVRE